MNSRRDTPLPYYGFLPSGALAVVAIVLLGSSRVVLNLVILVIGGVVATVLRADWLSGESPVAQTKDTAMSALLTTGRSRGMTLHSSARAVPRPNRHRNGCH